MVKTLPEVEQAIAQYSKHMQDLKKVIQEGTSQGQQAARAKLKEVKVNFDLLIKQRDRLAAEKGLGSYDQLFMRPTKPVALDTNRVKVIQILKHLLLDEYLQRDVYETYSYYLFGLCSPEIQQHLKEHRAHEDKHIGLLSRYLMGLRAEPLLKRHPVPKISPPIGNLLLFNLKLEQEAVAHYAAAIAMLETLKDPRFISLRVDLENILIEEQEHVHDLQQWMRSDVRSNESRVVGKSC